MNFKIVIFDIDGVLADNSHRLYHIESKYKDWELFFNQMNEDLLIDKYYDILLQYFENDHLIYLFTSRPENYRDMTEVWLYLNNIPYDLLVMREVDDRRPADEVKRDYLSLIADLRSVKAVYEDDPGCVEMFLSFTLDAKLVENLLL